MHAVEVNFDGYGAYSQLRGLSWQCRFTKSRLFAFKPQRALQGLKNEGDARIRSRARYFCSLARPDINVLKRLGFTGSDKQIIEKAFKADPVLLRACYMHQQ